MPGPDPTLLTTTIYHSLHELAVAQLRHERANSLQPTALVHEAWLRIAKLQDLQGEERARFFALAGKVMRHVVVDYARRRGAKKRDRGRGAELDLAETPGRESMPAEDVLALDEALHRLEAVDPDLVRVVDLMFFCGKTAAEIAELIGTSSRTVERRWRFARAWLRDALGGEDGDEDASA